MSTAETIETNDNPRALLVRGDCLEFLKKLDDNSIDSVVTDPPAGIEFMGKEWDSFQSKGATASGQQTASWDDSGGANGTKPFARKPTPRYRGKTNESLQGFQDFICEVFTEVYRVLKPGGHAVVWALPRTSHHTAMGLERAGFDIRDNGTYLFHVFGTGFPKSLNVGEGRGTALKPAVEFWILARKPLMTPDTNVRSVIESELRKRGVSGEILWKKGYAKDAEILKNNNISDSTKLSVLSETSAKSADENAILNEERQTQRSFDKHGTNGQRKIRGDSENSLDKLTVDCASVSSTPMEVGARVAVSARETFSQSTILTEAVHNTENRVTEKSTQSYGDADSLRGIECFAGIATGLTGSMATAHINRDSNGCFLWPKELPEFVRGTSLTVADNVQQYGTGALNIDGCRIPHTNENDLNTSLSKNPGRDDLTTSTTYGKNRPQQSVNKEGRWPAHLILDEGAAALMDEQSGPSQSRKGKPRKSKAPGDGWGMTATGAEYDDAGGASRFFYVAKASTKDKDEGLDAFATKSPGEKTEREDGTIGISPYAGSRAPSKNSHPTVKPTSLMTWLVRLVTPPGGVVLDPFMGSGSTGKAALREGFQFVGCEREQEYMEIAKARIEHELGGPVDVLDL